MEKITSKDPKTLRSYNMTINNFENFCMEKYGKQIVEFTDSKKINLIVIGSHGQTGFNRFILGSVSNGVSQSAKCPVLIIK